MLPEGAVHLPCELHFETGTFVCFEPDTFDLYSPDKGIAKVAKQLGVDYAETCTGFEFKKQRAIPVLTGIAVAEEYETLVLEVSHPLLSCCDYVY